MSPDVARAGGAVGAVGLALLLVAARRDLRIAGLVAWAAGCAVLATYLAPHGHHRLLAAAAVVGLGAAAGGTWLVLRFPWLLAFGTLACVPARIPVHVGSTQANLLLPIYGVAVVAALALAWELYGEELRVRELGPLAWPVAAFVGWDGLSLLWSQDVKQGAIELLFFVLPFGLLTLVLARLPWSRAWLLGLFAQLAAMAVVFAAIGIVQYEERDIFWNPKVIVDNAYAPSGWFYRVNCVFYDPSIYGRFLVVALVAGLVIVLRRTDPLWMIALALAIGITWAGLLPSFSQSSFSALFAAICVLLVVVWRRRAVVLVAVALVAARSWPAGLASDSQPARGQVLDVALPRHQRPLDARHEGPDDRRASPAAGCWRRRASSTPTRRSRICAARSRRPPRRTRPRSRSRPRPACWASRSCSGSRAPRLRSGSGGSAPASPAPRVSPAH